MVRPALAQTKRKSGDSCRLSHRFSCPLRGRQGNDKKVNEENSNFKNKGFVLSEEPLVEVHVSNVVPLLDTTYHFFWKNYKPFFRFFTDKRAKNRILEKRTNSTKSSRQTDEQA